MTDALPAATIRRRRWRFPVVWVVPVVAAIVAGYLVYGHLQELGPTITIEFKDVDGVKADQTEIRYRGVVVGQVTGIELSEDHQYAMVKARLRRAESSMARDGSLFWIVRPEVTMWTIRGLSTVITGPYIQVSPGTGPPTSKFTSLEGAPPSERPGLKITLATAQLRSLSPGSPVYYRGIEVGSVTATTLSRDATAAHVHVVVEPRYARLVRLGSRFWTVSGVDVNVGLFRGVEINLEALKALIAGGVAFASPEDPTAPPVKDETIFALHDKPEKQWLEWMPKINWR